MALADKLKAKQFVILAEMETPKGVDISAFVDNARHVKGRVDAAFVPDMGYAVMRLASLAGAVVLKDQGLEPVMQMNCRDRNRLALQGDLLAAHVMGVRNVAAAAGQPVHMGDHLQAKAVDDLKVPELLEAAQTLGKGQDLAGVQLKGAPEFCLGATLEPWADKNQAQVRLSEATAAVAKGASFLVTPPVFNLDAFAAFMKEADSLKVPVIASVLLLKSVGMARYLNQNVAGVDISEATIKRIRQASDRPAECVKIAAETVRALRDICGGALLISSGWEARLPEILDRAGA